MTALPTGRPFDVEELSAPECWTILRAGRIGRLAVCAKGRPNIFPVNYAVDDATIVFRTAAGTKLSASRRTHVAFEVDDHDPNAELAMSVVVSGQANEVTDADEWERVQSLPLFPWHVAPKRHFVRIVPDEVTGRRFRAPYAS